MRNIYLLDMAEDQIEENMQQAESNAAMAYLPDDDDFGERDGDEGF